MPALPYRPPASVLLHSWRLRDLAWTGTVGAGGRRAAAALLALLAAIAVIGIGTPVGATTASASTLAVGFSLSAGQSLTSPDGAYHLTLQTDGNLVLAGARVFWTTGTSGRGGSRLTMQPDGNLVLYTLANQPVWASYAYAAGTSGLVLASDSSLTISSGTTVVWAIRPAPDRLQPGEALWPGQAIVSAGGQYRLVLQADGNLVLYAASNAPVWWTGTSGPMLYLSAQTDGNVVLYDSHNRAVWYSGTAGRLASALVVGDSAQATLLAVDAKTALWRSPTSGDVLWRGQTLQPGAVLRTPTGWWLTMQTDGNLVRYSATNVAQFATLTFIPGSVAVMQTDGNLVVRAPSGTPVWSTGTSGTTATYLRISGGAGLSFLGDGGRPPVWIEGPPDWAALAACESGGNPHAVNPAGYYGLYQFDVSTWVSNGGIGNPGDASVAEQTRIASILYLARGRAPWPYCGRFL